MNNRKSTSCRRGFTLLELLTVIVILGFFSTMVIPQFSDATQNATETSVRTDLLQIRTQIEYFRADHYRLPSSLAELVDANLLQAAPRHPGALTYDYDATSGEITSPLDPTW